VYEIVAPTRKQRRTQCGGCAGDLAAVAERLQRLSQLLQQRAKTAEAAQARLHFEQHHRRRRACAVGQIEAHHRRESQRGMADRLQRRHIPCRIGLAEH
jgi:hypothetical protein